MAAFRRAASMGADMVELDVRRSRPTDVLVVHHNAHLPDGRAVASDRVPVSSRATVPALDEALAACEGMAVNIEIKNDPDEPGFDPGRRLSDDVAALVVARGDVERVLVSSFDLASLDRLKSCVPPAIATAWLVVGPPADADRSPRRPVATHALHPSVAGPR